MAGIIEDDEVHADRPIDEPTMASLTGLDFESIDEIHPVVEATAGAGADAVSSNGDGKIRLAGAAAANDQVVALLGD